MLLTLSVIAIATLFAMLGTRMALFDITHHLVRNRDLTVLGVSLAACGGLRAFSEARWEVLGFGALGAVLFALIYFVISALARGQLGSGDVWLAGLVGWSLGVLMPLSLVIGWAVPFALGAVPSMIVWARQGRSGQIAFVPFLIYSVPLTLLITAIQYGL